MKRLFLMSIVLMLLCVTLTQGCNKEKLAVATYEGVGQVLVTFKAEVEAMHVAGKITDEFYVKAKESYGKARASYILAGDALKLLIDLEDSIQRGAKLSESLKLLDEARDFIVSFMAVLESHGIKFEKVDSLISKLKS